MVYLKIKIFRKLNRIADKIVSIKL